MGGCADLPPIEQFACGNGVVEEGEACELSQEPYVCGAPETPQECRFVCNGGAPCPPGDGCGFDGECRHGIGAFDEAPGSPYRIEATDFHVGDIDGDTFPDIIGFNPAGFTARFGDEAGSFEGELDLAVTTTGLPGFGYLDGDSRLDVLAPTIGGLLGFQGASDRSFDSLPFASFDASFVNIGGRLLPVRTGNDLFDNLVLIIDNKMCHPNVCSAPPLVTGDEERLPGMHTADEILGEMPRGDLDNDLLGPRDEFAIAFQGGSQVFVYDLVDVSSDPMELFHAIKPNLRQTVTVPGTVKRNPFFIDLDVDGDLDLLVPVTVAGADRMVIASNDGSGMFGPADVAPWFNSFAGTCGTTPWPLAVGFLNDDGWPDYVGNRGICFGLTGIGFVNAVPLGNPELAWREAAIADFNRDGVNDVATTFEGLDGVDFYLGTGFLFNRDHVDTNDPPSRLHTGDFNGDFYLDLAVDEDGTLEESGNHSFSVLFGRPDGAPDFPASMARFAAVEDIQPLDLISVSAIDQITDMMVLSNDGATPPHRSATILFGDAEKQMQAPFLGEDKQTPFMAQIGHFSPEGDDVPDIVGMSMHVDLGAPTPINLTDTRLLYLHGGTGTQFPSSEVKIINYPNPNNFAETCSFVSTVDLDGDGIDSIVAVDGSIVLQQVSPFCAVDPDLQAQPRMITATIKMSGDLPAPEFDVVELPGTWYDTRHVDFHDLDGDGLPELTVTYGGMDGGTGAGVVAYWNHGGTISLSDPSPITEFTGDPLGATALNTDADARMELAVLTSEGIWLYSWEADSKQFEAAPRQVVALDPVPGDMNNVRGPAKIIAADINRDGIDDLVTTFGPKVHVYVAQSLDRAFVEGSM